MKRLQISETLKLPPSTDTSTIVIYGGKGMGKTNLGAVLAEEMAAAGLRWSWLDPLGVSWGLRHSADGTGPGIECLILGGLHGDVPIEPTGGAAVADVVVEESVNVLIDFSRKPSGEMWSLGEKVRFVTAYAMRLFQRQGEIVHGRRRENLFQILDEAARYIPQQIPAGDKLGLPECQHAWNMIVEEGRNIGLGVGLLTQRSARMSKSVSELADVMFAFRTIGPNSLDAVGDWLGEHVDKTKLKEMLAQVRTLDVGQALVVSPGWLKVEGVHRIRPRHTYDSSATQKPGERTRAVKGDGAKPDLVKIRERMAETIERAKADDPKELKRRIAEQATHLVAKDKEIKRLQLQESAPKRSEIERRDVPVLTTAERELLKAVREELAGFKDYIGARADATLQAIADRAKAEIDAAAHRWTTDVEKRRALFVERLSGTRIQRILEKVDQASTASVAPRQAPVTRITPTERHPSPGSPSPAREPRTSPAAGSESNGTGLSKSERKILTVLAQQPDGCDKGRLTLLTGYRYSGGFINSLSSLRTAGYLLGGNTDTMRITDAGLAAIGPVEPLPTGAELGRYWLQHPSFSKAARAILGELLNHPAGRTKEQLCEATGYAYSGGFINALSELRRAGVLVGKNTAVMRADSELFG